MGSKSYVNTQTENYDERIAVEGGVDELIGPGATVATLGSTAIKADDGATVTATVTHQGIDAGNVKGMMDSIFANAAAERSSVTGLGQSLAAGMKDQAAQLGDIVEATKTPGNTTLMNVLPILALGLVLFFMFGRKG